MENKFHFCLCVQSGVIFGQVCSLVQHELDSASGWEIRSARSCANKVVQKSTITENPIDCKVCAVSFLWANT